MTTDAEWKGRVGRSWADNWYATDRTFAPVTARLLDRASEEAFNAAIDIGSGAGELTCALQRLAPAAHVTGVDVSPDLVDTARDRYPEITFQIADAATFCPPGPAPDFVISRHGVMFFADPEAAFAHLRALAAPRARLLFSCFRARAENGWVSDLGALVGAYPADDGLHNPGPFAFADSDAVHALLARAGWRDVAFERLDYAMVAGEGPDAVAEATEYFQRIGPAAAAIAAMAPAAADAARVRLRTFLATRIGQSTSGALHVALPASAWIVSARA